MFVSYPSVTLFTAGKAVSVTARIAMDSALRSCEYVRGTWCIVGWIDQIVSQPSIFRRCLNKPVPTTKSAERFLNYERKRACRNAS